MKLQKEYGAAGIGFYLMALLLMARNNGWHYLSHLMGLRCRGMSMATIACIVKESGLFELLPNDVVILADIDRNGVEGFRKSVFMECRRTRPWECDSRTRAQAGAQASAQVGAQAGARDCVHAGTIRNEIDKTRLDQCVQSEALKRDKFYRFMETSCPNLMHMPQPLLYEEYLMLRNKYSADQIMKVLVAMDNELEVCETKRSGFRTALAWLEHRYSN